MSQTNFLLTDKLEMLMKDEFERRLNEYLHREGNKIIRKVLKETVNSTTFRAVEYDDSIDLQIKLNKQGETK